MPFSIEISHMSLPLQFPPAFERIHEQFPGESATPPGSVHPQSFQAHSVYERQTTLLNPVAITTI